MTWINIEHLTYEYLYLTLDITISNLVLAVQWLYLIFLSVWGNAHILIIWLEIYDPLIISQGILDISAKLIYLNFLSGSLNNIPYL
jgi:hypothetical protein